MVVFFFASAAASSAYLTVSETFPLEIRALAIAIFYAIGTGIGGVAGPWLFGALIDTGSRVQRVRRLPVGAALMIGGGARRLALRVATPNASRSNTWRARWRFWIKYRSAIRQSGNRFAVRLRDH